MTLSCFQSSVTSPCTLRKIQIPYHPRDPYNWPVPAPLTLLLTTLPLTCYTSSFWASSSSSDMLCSQKGSAHMLFSLPSTFPTSNHCSLLLLCLTAHLVKYQINFLATVLAWLCKITLEYIYFIWHREDGCLQFNSVFPIEREAWWEQGPYIFQQVLYPQHLAKHLAQNKGFMDIYWTYSENQ